MIDTKRFKEKILSLAYQGELTDSQGNNYTNDNLESIHRQIKGYIPVSKDEFLITTPDHWKWTRLDYVTYNHGQTTPESTFSYIDVGTLDNVNHRLSYTENIVEAEKAPSRAKKIVEYGDVIYSTVRPYLHNICIIDKEFMYRPIASTAFCVMHAKEEVLYNKYLFYWLLTTEFDKYSNGDPSKGALYPAIGEKDLLKGGIPLPGIDEQKLIVSKIEAAFALVDEINNLQSQYISNQEVLKNKLISAGIQGKLTRQLSEDGDSEKLYEQIQDEKDRLIKEKRIKKEKPLPPILEDEIPYEIPSSWKWVRLSDISYRIWAGGDKPDDFTAESDEERQIPVVANGVKNEGILGYTSKATARENTITVAGRGTIGFTVFRKYDYCPIVRLIVIEQSKYIEPRYLQLFLQSMPESSVGSSIPQLTVPMIRPKLVPLPPLKEQIRIAEHLSELLNIISES